MRILICATRMGIGGAETHVLSLARALADGGHTVSVASSGGAYTGALASSGIRHISLPLDRRDPVSFLRARAGLLREARGGRYDIVHAHGRIPSFICGTLRRAAGFPPLAVTVHGLYDPDISFSRFSVWGRKTVAVSADVKDYLTGTYGLDPARITVIPNGVETDVPPHIPSDGLRILTVSRLDRDTALTALLLCSLMPRLRHDFPALKPCLIIAGGGELLPRVRDAARTANAECGGCVVVAGAVTDVPQLLARADIFVGSSRAALEAMAAGLPVVLCADSGCAGVLDERTLPSAVRTNFTCRGEPAADIGLLRAALERLAAAGDAECAALGSFGREVVRRSYSVGSVAARTLALWRELLDEERPGIMICGYFGAGNAGDDASLEAILRSLRGINPKLTPTVPVRRGGRLPGGVRGIGRFDYPALRRELLRTRLFILGGGSLLQNVTSDRSLRYYTWLCALASRCGARVMLWGGGAGPLTGNRAARLAVRAVEGCDTVCLRDPDSGALLTSLGADGSGFRVSADPALLTGAASLRKGIVKPGERCFAVSLRPLSHLRGGCDAAAQKAIPAIREAAAALAAKHSLTPLWLPLSPDDEEICRTACRLAGCGRVLPVLTPGEYVALLGKCLFVLGLRLHSAVFAACAGIPAITVSYDPKVASFAELSGHPPALDPAAPGFGAEKIIAAAHGLEGNYADVCAGIRERAAGLREAAAGDGEAAAALYRRDI